MIQTVFCLPEVILKFQTRTENFQTEFFQFFKFPFEPVYFTDQRPTFRFQIHSTVLSQQPTQISTFSNLEKWLDTCHAHTCESIFTNLVGHCVLCQCASFHILSVDFGLKLTIFDQYFP